MARKSHIALQVAFQVLSFIVSPHLPGSSRVEVRVCSRLLLVFFIFYAMMFVCSVLAELKTSFTVVKPRFYDGFEDLANDDSVDIILLSSGTLTNWIKTSNDPVFRKIWKRVNKPGHIMDEPPMSPESFKVEILDKLMAGKTVFLGEKPFVSVLATLSCSDFSEVCYGKKDSVRITLITQKVSGTTFTWVVSKKSDPAMRAHLAKVNDFVNRHGTLDPWYYHVTGTTAGCIRENLEAEQSDMESVVAESTFTLLECWAAGMAVSTLCLVLEILVHVVVGAEWK